MAAPASNKFRTIALTGSVAAITATGAWYGAGLKTSRELTHGRSAVLEATPAERIQQMETARARLMQRRLELHTKINRLTTKVNRESSTDGPQAG